MSLLAGKSELWREPTVDEADDRLHALRRASWYKVKAGGKLEPRYFILTVEKLMYTAAEDSTAIRCELELGSCFVEFDDPVENRLESLHNPHAADHDKSFEQKEFQMFHPDYQFEGMTNLSNHANPSRGAETQKGKNEEQLEGIAYFIDSYGDIDTGYIWKFVKKRYPQAYDSLKSISHKAHPDQSAKKLKPEHLFTVKLRIDTKFTEIATYNYNQFQDWKTLFSQLCLQSDFKRNFAIEKVLKDGDLSKICIVHRLSNKTNCLAKIYSKYHLGNDEEQIDLIKQEIRLHKSVFHRSLPKLLEVYEETPAIILIFENFTGPTIEQVYETKIRYSDEEVILLLYQVLQVLGYLHSEKIVHRDINPANIILKKQGRPTSKNPAALVGLSRAVSLTKFGCINASNVQCGRLGFQAPELTRVYHQSEFDLNLFKSDVYSLGRVIYCLMSGADGFESEKERQSNPSGERLPFNFSFGKYPTDLKTLVKSMLNPDPPERPTVSELLDSPLFERSCIQSHESKERAGVHHQASGNHTDEDSISHHTLDSDSSLSLEAKDMSKNKIYPVKVNGMQEGKKKVTLKLPTQLQRSKRSSSNVDTLIFQDTQVDKRQFMDDQIATSKKVLPKKISLQPKSNPKSEGIKLKIPTKEILDSQGELSYNIAEEPMARPTLLKVTLKHPQH